MIEGTKVELPGRIAESAGTWSVGAMRKGLLTNGPMVRKFEDMFATAHGAEFGVACNSGTSALEMIIRGLGIHGETIVVPDNTFFATALAVMRSGNRVKLVDVNKDTLALDADKLEHSITSDVAAVILVHIGGHISTEIERIVSICEESGVDLIEDCAHAHYSGAEDRFAGTFGIAGAFSFYATKVMTTGEGGMVLTKDGALSREMKTLRNHGKEGGGADQVVDLGYNWRMTEAAAALGIAQIKYVMDWLAPRIQAADEYMAAMVGHPNLKLPTLQPKGFSSWYKVPVMVNELITPGDVEPWAWGTSFFGGKDIQLPGAVYRLPVHSHPVWNQYDAHGEPGLEAWMDSSYPGANEVARTQICLPIYPSIVKGKKGERPIDAVLEAIEEFKYV